MYNFLWCRRTNKGIKYSRLLQLRVGRPRSKNCVASICSQNYQFLYTLPPPFLFFFFYNKMKYTFEQKRMFLQTLGLLEIKE